MTATLEQDLEKVFLEGFEIAESQDKGENLTPVRSDEIRTDKDRARVIGEISYTPLTTLTSFNSPDKAIDEVMEIMQVHETPSFRNSFSNAVASKELLIDRVRFHLSARHHAEGSLPWLSQHLLTRSETFEYFFTIPKHKESSEEREWINAISQDPPDNVLQVYSKYFPKSIDGLFYLSSGIESGRINPTEALDLYKRFLEREDTRRDTLSHFVHLIRAMKNGFISGNDIIEVYDNLIDSEKHNKDNLNWLCADFDEVIEAIPLGRVDPSDVINLYRRLNRYGWRFTMGSRGHLLGALQNFAECIPSGKISPYEVLGLFRETLELLPNATVTDATITSRGIDTLSRVSKGKPYQSVAETIEEEFYRIIYTIKKDRIVRELDEENIIKMEAARGHRPGETGFCLFRDFFNLFDQGKMIEGEFVTLFEKMIDHDDLSSEDYKLLIKSGYTGKIDPRVVIRLIRKAVNKRPSRISVPNAMHSLEYLLDGVKTGLVDGNEVEKIFHEGLPELDSNNISNEVNNLFRTYACLIAITKGNPKKVFDLFNQQIYDKDGSSLTAARNLGEFRHLVRAGLITSDDVIEYYKKIISEGGLFSGTRDYAAGAVVDLIDLIPDGKITLKEVTDLIVHTLQQENLQDHDSLGKSLHKLAEKYPEQALDMYRKIEDKLAGITLFDNGGAGNFYKIAGTYRAMYESLREFLKEYESPHADEFLRFMLAFGQNEARNEKLLELYKRNNVKKAPSNEEIIWDHVEGRDLKQYEKIALAEMLTKSVQRFKREHAKMERPGGFSAEGVIDITDDVVKIASIDQNKREDLVYSLQESLDDTFPRFTANKRGSIIELEDGLSLLILENLDKRKKSGYELATELYKRLTSEETAPWQTEHPGHNDAMLNLFLLGLAHKSLRRANENGVQFPDTEYTTLREKVPQWQAIKMPLSKTSFYVQRTQMKPVSSKLIYTSGRITEKFLEEGRKKERKSIIIGDNKVRENMRNGYMHDFALVGRGSEIEDVVYGLVEPRLRLSPQRKVVDRRLIRRCVHAYVSMRCIHDDEFRKHAISTEQEMLAMTDAAILNALNIYAGCTRKRWEKMESGEIWGRRKYFIDSMEYMLKQGDFSTFRAA